MKKAYYKTVKRAELATTGYIRIHLHADNISSGIQQLCSDYFGYFFIKPWKDPSNFITSKDIKQSLKHKKAGNKLMQQNDYNKSLEKYKEALSYNPNDAKILCNRCLCYLQLNKYQNAFADARYSVINAPLWHKSWLRLGQVFEAMRKYIESCNMVEHAINICASSNYNNIKHIQSMEKYLGSLIAKKHEYYKLNPNKLNINHINDEDRLEWKYSTPGKMPEKCLNDEQLVNCWPYKIRYYRNCIVPKCLENSNEMDEEYARWLQRKWIKKVMLFESLNQYKLLLNSYYRIVQSPINKDPIRSVWYVTWYAMLNLYLNKRCFMVNIWNNKEMLFAGDIYCKPTAKFIIQCIKLAILCPFENNENIKIKDVKYPLKPSIIQIKHRMKDEFDSIVKELRTVGVFCVLESKTDEIRNRPKYKTHVYGWNYLDSKPRYTYDNTENFNFE